MPGPVALIAVVRLALGAVDRGVGGGVHDDIGSQVAHARPDRVGIREVERPPVRRDHLPERRQPRRELPADLPGRAGEEDPQG